MIDVTILWDLALTHNSSLREAQADVEAARGRLIQAGKYPNPHVRYEQDLIGSDVAHQGNLKVEFSQEIVTAGKKRLDRAIAGHDVDITMLALRKRSGWARARRFLDSADVIDPGLGRRDRLGCGLPASRQGSG